jgi:hypothetical protein
MLPGSTPISLVQHYLKAQEGVTEVARISADDVRYTVGERVHATVASLLPNGRFAVLIKDQLLDLNLPRNTEPGEKLDLTVVTSNPRLTFSINTAATPQPALPQEMALSQGAKFLSSLLAKGEAKRDVIASVLNQSPPLFDGEPNTESLAEKLSQSLADSGLFYESHQAEWVNGERPLQTLLREPQAMLSKQVPQIMAAIENELPDTQAVTTSTKQATVGVMTAEVAPSLNNTNTQEIAGKAASLVVHDDEAIAFKPTVSSATSQTLQDVEGLVLAEKANVNLGVLKDPAIANGRFGAGDVSGKLPLQSQATAPQAGLLFQIALPRVEVPIFAKVQQSMATQVSAEEKTDLVGKPAVATTMTPEGVLEADFSIQGDSILRHLVQQQLDVLEQRPIVWNGQAWPGQPVRWEVETENEREARSGQNEVQRSWQSRMDLQLPNLGDVGIVAVLRNGEFALRFEASPATAEKIRAETQSLQNRFEAAGLTLVSSQVVAAEPVNVT